MRPIATVLVLLTLVIGLFLIQLPAAQATGARPLRDAAAFASSPDHQTGPATADAAPVGVNALNNTPPIRATYRISIPYGFDSPLPVLAAGRDVVTSGHGGCTAGQQVTVAITVTQTTSGAQGTGDMQQACTGALQRWNAVATANTTSAFSDGAAEACGFATTRDGDGYVTDTFEWCKDVELVTLEEQVYLPLIAKP